MTVTLPPAHDHSRSARRRREATSCMDLTLGLVSRPHGCIHTRLVLGAIAPRRGLAVHASDVTSDLLYPRVHERVPARGRALVRSVITDVHATLPQLLRADASGPPYPTGRLNARELRAHRAGAGITQTASGPGGFTATGAGQLINAPAGQAGEQLSVSVQGRVSRSGATATLTQGLNFGVFADLCPDPTGEVDGTGVARTDLGGAFAAGLKRGVVHLIDRRRVHVSRPRRGGWQADRRCAHLRRDNSYDGPAPGLLGIGHVDAHFRAHTHVVFDHLQVGVPINDADFDRQLSNYQTSGFGLAGVLSGAYRNAISAIAIMVYLAKSDADSALTQDPAELV